MAVPWIKGMVSKRMWTKKFQDFECRGSLELVLHQRDVPAYLELSPLVRENLRGKTPEVPRWFFNHLGKMARRQRKKLWGCSAVGWGLRHEKQWQWATLSEQKSSILYLANGIWAAEGLVQELQCKDGMTLSEMKSRGKGCSAWNNQNTITSSS